MFKLVLLGHIRSLGARIAVLCANLCRISPVSERSVGDSTVTRKASNMAAENRVLKQAARCAGCGRACNVQGLKVAVIPERQRVPDALNLLPLSRWRGRLLVLADR